MAVFIEKGISVVARGLKFVDGFKDWRAQRRYEREFTDMVELGIKRMFEAPNLVGKSMSDLDPTERIEGLTRAINRVLAEKNSNSE